MMLLSKLIDEPVDRDVDILGVTADSRQVRPGYLFAALPGVAADGAAFIPDAVNAGAAAVLARPGVEAPIPTAQAENPRRTLALIAARFYQRQPETAVAVTGTNGKTSIAQFTAQLWARLGLEGASLGTLGVEAPGYTRPLRHTTPDPVEIHDVLAELAARGVDHVALEASSHGLAQHRLDGVRVRAAAFSNITQDHLDYHPTFQDYLTAKLRLFTDVLEADGVAVVNADGAGADHVFAACAARGVKTLSVGEAGRDWRITEQRAHGAGRALRIEAGGRIHAVELPLIGGFQASNVLAAAGLVHAGDGVEFEALVPHFSALRGVRGRMEFV
ncbi:MAG: UDP-N-acetylmuramoyl-L-alanyl-D-glutamate--2,6-diaminopimelate ligase, partial [Pseudomonadota bacterium]